MIIKKYSAKTEDEAMNIAKKELGADVVLMNSRTVKQKGILKLFKAPFVEITVALEEQQSGIDKKPQPMPPVHTGESSSRVDYYARDDIDLKTISQVAEVVNKQERDNENGSVTPVNETKDVAPNPAPAPAPYKSAKKVMEEDTKAINNNIMSTEGVDDSDKVYGVIAESLEDNEVKSSFVEQIIGETQKYGGEEMPMEYIVSHIYQRMILKFGNPEPIKPAEKGPKYIFFVGTTGVGKTTTIAKIASKMRLEEKKKVAFITADTYRIAAAEQLHTYANILQVPFVIIYNMDDLNQALTNFQNFDYVLVDTAGHSHKNEEQRDTMAEYINFVKEKTEIEVFLVLSATTKYTDLLSVVDCYKEVFDYKIIFTKLDETSSYGNILNIRMHTLAPIGYVTTGQNVPDDIEVFNPQSIVKKLLGGR